MICLVCLDCEDTVTAMAEPRRCECERHTVWTDADGVTVNDRQGSNDRAELLEIPDSFLRSTADATGTATHRPVLRWAPLPAND